MPGFAQSQQKSPAQGRASSAGVYRITNVRSTSQRRQKRQLAAPPAEGVATVRPLWRFLAHAYLECPPNRRLARLPARWVRWRSPGRCSKSAERGSFAGDSALSGSSPLVMTRHALRARRVIWSSASILVAASSTLFKLKASQPSATRATCPGSFQDPRFDREEMDESALCSKRRLANAAYSQRSCAKMCVVSVLDLRRLTTP
jgi:hypothetical protein